MPRDRKKAKVKFTDANKWLAITKYFHSYIARGFGKTFFNDIFTLYDHRKMSKRFTWNFAKHFETLSRGNQLESNIGQGFIIDNENTGL